MKKTVKITAISFICIAYVLMNFTFLRLAAVRWCNEFSCYDIADKMWDTSLQETVDYSMLSDNLKALVTEEEFSDTSDKGRLNVYRKLENAWFVDKEHFPGGSDQWKTPPGDVLIIDGKKYDAVYEYSVDLNYKALIPKPEIVNFKCYIYEINSGITA